MGTEESLEDRRSEESFQQAKRLDLLLCGLAELRKSGVEYSGGRQPETGASRVNKPGATQGRGHAGGTGWQPQI